MYLITPDFILLFLFRVFLFMIVAWVFSLSGKAK